MMALDHSMMHTDMQESKRQVKEEHAKSVEPKAMLAACMPQQCWYRTTGGAPCTEHAAGTHGEVLE